MNRRRALAVGASAVAALGGVFVWRKFVQFPPDTTPEGVYLRIAYNLSRGDGIACFPYLEDQAQHAAYSIRDYRKKASERINATYPEPERTKLLAEYKAHAEAPDGA